jgi:hypothetical protein
VAVTGSAAALDARRTGHDQNVTSSSGGDRFGDGERAVSSSSR